MSTSEIIESLTEIVGAKNISTDQNNLNIYGLDRTHQFTPSPIAILFPHTVKQVQKIVQLANRDNFKLVPSGGRTGLSGGACAISGEVVISMGRMNKITEFNAIDRLVSCEAGVVTATLQSFATEKNLFFPIDLASAGSSHIGGNVATNAGGNRVMRYGMMRQWVRGLTVVTGNGDILYLGHGLKKNNAGYDLMQLFIGSEGTLGVICEVTIELISQPDIQTVLIGLSQFEEVLDLYAYCQTMLSLLSYEYFSHAALEHTLTALKRNAPFNTQHHHYVLIEHNGDRQKMEDFLAQWQAGKPLTEITVATNSNQQKLLKAYREGISEAVSPCQPLKCDISVKTSKLLQLFTELEELALSASSWSMILFGHIGDGNLHVNFVPPARDSLQQQNKLEEAVYNLVQALDGSFSAEHGIGLLKKHLLTNQKSPLIVAQAQSLTKIFNRAYTLNPNKIY